MFGLLKRKAEKNYDIRDLDADLQRNDYRRDKLKCTVTKDVYTVKVDINGDVFELTYGQAALMFLSLKKMYVE